jgi:hypothetical protein
MMMMMMMMMMVVVVVVGVIKVIFQHPVALYRSDFWSFCAVYVQRRSLFFLRIPLLDIIYFGLTGLLQVYRPLTKKTALKLRQLKQEERNPHYSEYQNP